MSDHKALDLTTGEVRTLDAYGYRGVGLPENLVWLDQATARQILDSLPRFMALISDQVSVLATHVTDLHDAVRVGEEENARLEGKIDELERLLDRRVGELE